ncbi:EGF region [Echinococcus multilocularis]|uniref:EGF region n=1 Tax=Echinococcus multilocularis TaxID=6211 RepID=A0A068Y1N1_ECHMU|nr:EGF region [Echinococcus multilocularis]
MMYGALREVVTAETASVVTNVNNVDISGVGICDALTCTRYIRICGATITSHTPMLMFASTNSLLFAVFFSASLLLVNSRIIVTECANGTPTCSHGRCVQRMGWDEEGHPVDEQRCICDPNYYGEACALLVVSDFANPLIISPGPMNMFAPPEPRDRTITDPVNEKHAYGGAV